MACIVQKFGGTSVGSIESIRQVAEIVSASHKKDYQIVVVVSAMAGETDRLIRLAKSCSNIPDTREYASLISTGEQVSSALLTLCLLEMGIPAQSFTGRQAGILTDAVYDKARIQDIDTTEVQACLDANKVAVIAGFQGVDWKGNTTTLGRGGSDTTAVALASALKAEECQIYTDVDGVYTSDPRLVSTARRLATVPFEEMFELASLGSKVLQQRAVEFAGKYKVPLRVLSTKAPDAGTLVEYKEVGTSLESPQIAGITYSRNEAKVVIQGISNGAQAMAAVLTELGDISVNVDMTVQYEEADGSSTVAFTINSDDYALVLNHFENALHGIAAKKIYGVTKLSKISLVGAGLKSHPEIAPKVFQALSDIGVLTQMVSSSELKLSVLVHRDYLEKAVQRLHEQFHLHQNVSDISSDL